MGRHCSDVTKLRIRLVRLGNKNPMWKDDVGYNALHGWINRNRAKPMSGLCEICNITPLYDVANITGVYNRDFKNWKYACRSCHMRFDYDNGIRKRTADFGQICKSCGSSIVVSPGIRGPSRRFKCRNCRKGWSIRLDALVI